MDIVKMVARKKELTPETGFNVVGVDRHAIGEAALYLVGRYTSRKAAKEALSEHSQRSPEDTFHIYEPKGS